jgi:hypothetical protein
MDTVLNMYFEQQNAANLDLDKLALESNCFGHIGPFLSSSTTQNKQRRAEKSVNKTVLSN